MPKKKEDHSLTKEEREILAEKLKPPSGMANWLNSSDIKSKLVAKVACRL